MIGDVLCGRYEITRRLGGGAMAEVYLATDRQADNKPVAVKIINTEKLYQPKSVERFVREGVLLCKLQHPNLIQGLDRGRHENRAFIVMEYVDGPTIADLIKKRGHLPMDEAKKLLLDVASGFDYLFVRGAIQAHRDIKPTNIMVTEGGIAKIADFGIAKSASVEEEMTLTTAFLGSPYYMSPEQIEDPRMADIRSDLYSLGAVFYEMMTGEKAFPGKSSFEVIKAHSELEPPTFGSDVDGGVADYVLAKTLAIDSRDRFQNPRELIEYLAPKVGADVTVAVPRFSRNATRLALAAASLSILTAIAIGWAATTWRAAPPNYGAPASAPPDSRTATLPDSSTEPTQVVPSTPTDQPAKKGPPARDPVGSRTGSGGSGVSAGAGSSGLDANKARKNAVGGP